ncbi:hypothetical protein RMQ97_07180 [Maricaulis sp. D1M11]|uniref:hypothetical protein n=1 Tax=Maricaulis sp. D1M11 TaxID=3076117 RepID=UPI0039B640F9
MRRLISITALPILLSACAVVQAPDTVADNPDWVNDRLDQELATRAAPEFIPDTRLPHHEARSLDVSAGRLARLARRAEIDAAQTAGRQDSDTDINAMIERARDLTSEPD